MQSTPCWQNLPPSTKRTLHLDVCQQADGTLLRIALQVIQGKTSGKTLVLLGAIHGDEYEGPASLWRMYEQLDPELIRGSVVMVPVANPAAYNNKDRVAPDDHKDLARTFPGSPKGSVTEQIAYLLHHEVIAHADFMCDFHSAGQLYRIDPWVGYALVADEAILEQQRRAARVVGYPFAWGTQLLPGRSLSSAAFWNVPALYVEAPGEGRCHAEDVERNCLVVRQLLSLHDMVDEPLVPFEVDQLIEDHAEGSGHLQTQLVTKHAGFFEPYLELGQSASEGEPFGVVRGIGGEILESIAAPTTGKLVFLRTFPLVKPGDSLGTIRNQD